MSKRKSNEKSKNEENQGVFELKSIGQVKKPTGNASGSSRSTVYQSMRKPTKENLPENLPIKTYELPEKYVGATPILTAQAVSDDCVPNCDPDGGWLSSSSTNPAWVAYH